MVQKNKVNIALIVLDKALCYLYAVVTSAIVYQDTFHSFCPTLVGNCLKAMP